jgi:nitroimidazol reductase NimA-like FMN-containing flavoprotein (pyridoxamine 5'-phosphate oxidase superfamily)
MTAAGKTPELSAGLETFLESVGRGFLITRRRDGSPTAHPLTPLWAEGAIHFNTYRKSAKVRNLRAHPQVACVVTTADDDPSYFALECRGTAVVLDLADIPDSILGVDDNGEVMDAADLARVRKNVASGKRIYLRVVPEEWTVCEALAPGVAPLPGERAPDPDAMAGAMVPSHIAMTAEEAVDFLRQKHVAVLGTVDGEGSPRGRPVRYTVGRSVLHLTVPRLSPSLVDLAEGSAAAATVEEFPSYDTIRGVMAHGPTRFFVDAPSGDGLGEWTEVGLRVDRLVSFDFRKISRAH